MQVIVPFFDGQTLTVSGHYTARYSTNQCDSIVHLFLTVATSRIQSISGCDSVLFNGQYHYTSKQFIDTIRSFITQCDSLYLVTRLTVNTASTNYMTLCLATGQTYDLNGQSLSQTGQYVTTYTGPGRCDSIVHLYLVIGKQEVSFVSGCGQVFYNGTNFTTSTTVYDTIKSVVTNCDSLIQITKIQVNSKPQINITSSVTICKGDSIQLTANAASATITWTGFGANNSIKVSPVVTTTYTAFASDANSCVNSAVVTVFVEDFSLHLSLSPNPVLEGNNALLQTTSILPYNIQEWMPVNLFPNQKLKTQQFKADTSLNISVAGRSNGGCLDTAYARLVVTPFDDIYIPSGFTPNGDGKNETITVRGSGIKELDFKIFNRWGQLLFATTDKFREWDGKSVGVLQPAGTYVYVLEVQTITGRKIIKKGTITCIY